LGAKVEVVLKVKEEHMSRSLNDIQADLVDCRRCLLSETRTHIVFGVGNPTAEVMFIGEAPGKQEDLGAEPFIGAAGQYLNQMLALAGLKREEIYIANVLKCRPPENRDPRSDEIEVCTPFLREQVRAIGPEILVTLGNFATRFILKTDRGISGLRGQVHITGRFSVLPIFHPAAAIYDRNKGPIMEDDFRLLGRLIATRREERARREEHTQASREEHTQAPGEVRAQHEERGVPGEARAQHEAHAQARREGQQD
jgi:DNA polymerase